MHSEKKNLTLLANIHHPFYFSELILGLNSVLAPKESAKPKTNNIEGLKQKLAEFSQKLPWIERLDMINKPAPLAPELGKVKLK